MVNIAFYSLTLCLDCLTAKIVGSLMNRKLYYSDIFARNMVVFLPINAVKSVSCDFIQISFIVFLVSLFLFVLGS